tara:strand:+ start:1162 stop:1275 length:114 start_codon:yes stop_codon:yes gene_type:complete
MRINGGAAYLLPARIPAIVISGWNPEKSCNISDACYK